MSSRYKVIGIIVLLFHLIGAIGTLLPQTRELVLPLTPFNLFLSSILLIYGHQGPKKPLFLFLIVSFVLGFMIEVVGVKTGFPFGDYAYGKTLGIKAFNVPLIIGLNWFLLSYLFGSLAQSVFQNHLVRILGAAFGMMILDLLIEPVAVQLDYWQWQGGIPIENYISWFVIGGIIQLVFVKLEFRIKNPLVIPLILAQVLYFTVLFFAINI